MYMRVEVWERVDGSGESWGKLTDLKQFAPKNTKIWDKKIAEQAKSCKNLNSYKITTVPFGNCDSTINTVTHGHLILVYFSRTPSVERKITEWC